MTDAKRAMDDLIDTIVREVQEVYAFTAPENIEWKLRIKVTDLIVSAAFDAAIRDERVALIAFIRRMLPEHGEHVADPGAWGADAVPG